MALEDERLGGVFSYPVFVDSHYSRVLSSLRSLGISSIESHGPTEITGVRVLGKGCVGIVVSARRGQERVAAKILRTDANRSGLGDEAANLQIANGRGVGPLLHGYADLVLVMEYIDGLLLVRWLTEPHTSREVGHVLRSLLAQCRRLDMAGLDHGELSDARKHIIVDRFGRPRIIDFETASVKRNCRNLSSMVNYLFFKESISMLTGRAVCLDREGVREALRRYKRHPSDENYEKLMIGAGLGSE